MNSRLRFWTFIFIGGGAVALIAIIATSIWLARQTSELANALNDVRTERALVTEVQTSLLDLETGQRGFLLTFKPGYLEPYFSARSRVIHDVERLRARFRGDTAEETATNRLTALVRTKLDELAYTLLLAQTNRFPEALAIVRSDRGESLDEQAQALLARIDGAVEYRVDFYSARLRGAAAMLRNVTVLGGALIVLFATAAGWLIVHYLDQTVRARQEVEALNLGLENRVAERTAALTRANGEIQRFAHIVSHDLRAPLLNITGFAGELESAKQILADYLARPDEPDSEAKARQATLELIPEALQFIRISTTKMEALINAILKLAREGQRELNPEPVDMAAVVETVCATQQHHVLERNVRLETKGEFPTIVTDRLALDQIFGNVIDNAIKYLDETRPGHVIIEGKVQGPALIIDVTDNGRGIAEQDQERIFELFRRVGAQDQRGEGIGLAHVRALTRRLGGDVSVRSEIGRGSTFRIEISRNLSATARLDAA